MKKLKRILAAAGALLLFGMYASTLVFALIDHSATMGLLKASIACTIILPVLLYAYTLVYKITRGNQDTDHASEYQNCDSDRKHSDDQKNSGAQDHGSTQNHHDTQGHDGASK